MNIPSIQRIPRTIQIGSETVQAHELSVSLPFTRKPMRLDEVSQLRQEDERVPVFILETKELSTAEYDAFAGSLLESSDWLSGKGGCVLGDGYLCVEVVARGRPPLYVNPEGSDYARYVARLG